MNYINPRKSFLKQMQKIINIYIRSSTCTIRNQFDKAATGPAIDRKIYPIFHFIEW